MKKKRVTIFKWLVLAVCLFTAGLFYSFHSGGTSKEAVTVQKGGTSSTEASLETEQESTGEDPKGAFDGTEKTENAETLESKPEKTESETAALLPYYVYVCGEVVSPGVYRLPEGSRIFEAVNQAGGFTDQAAESWLNLAEPVTDGMKLEVPSKAQVKDPSWLSENRAKTGSAGGGSLTSAVSAPALVNLNTASLEELMTLKGIGQSRAEDIIRYRKEAGGFSKIEDIMKVPGIKDAAFQKIKENITV